MKTGSNRTELIYITQSTTDGEPRRRGSCRRGRPCNRASCEYCWHRKVRFLTQQLEALPPTWSLKSFATIVVRDAFDHPQIAIKALLKLRPKLNRTLRGFGKYIVVISVVAADAEQTAPHFHMLMGFTNADSLGREVLKWMPYRIDVHVAPVRSAGSVGHLQKALFYMLNYNLKPSLACRPRSARLMSAAKGFFTGRPRYQKRAGGFYEI